MFYDRIYIRSYLFKYVCIFINDMLQEKIYHIFLFEYVYYNFSMRDKNK